MDLNLMNCPVSYALGILDGKWKIPIVWIVGTEKVIRFNELKRRIAGNSSFRVPNNCSDVIMIPLLS
jgi:DNA-binding HxlR family transcriptional regulator